MSVIRRAFEKRSSLPPGGWAADNLNVGANSLLGAAVDSGVQVNERRALGLPAVYACSRVIADAGSATPLRGVESVNGVDRFLPRGSIPFVDDPFIDVDQQIGLFQMLVSLALRGNSYSLVMERDRLGRPMKLQTLHPDVVSMRKNTAGDLMWRVGTSDIDLADIIHIPLFALPGSTLGLSPIDIAAQGLGIALATESYAARFFGQGATTMGVIEIDTELDDVQARRLATAWSAAHGGFRRAHLPAVLSGGATFKPISVPNDAAQFIESRSFQRSEIAMLFGVPPHMIGVTEKTTSWGSGIQQQSIGFVRYTLRGYLSRIENTFSRMLPDGQFARFDLRDLLRGDLAERYAAYQIGRNGGWLSINDIRRDEGLDPIVGIGDDYLLPMNSSLNGADIGPLNDSPKEPSA
jgi:HK97 family phage portal protein